MPITSIAFSRHGFRCLWFEGSESFGPVIVRLHGSGERGDDLSQVSQRGLPAALHYGRMQTNAAVMCPQLEAGIDWEPNRLRKLLLALKAAHRAVVLVGFSLGGRGVCDLLTNTGSIADLHVSVAGRVQQLPTIDQTGTQFLTVSGALDPWPAMGHFVKRIVGLGGAAEEVVVANQGHFITEIAFAHPRFLSLAHDVGIQLCIANNHS
jgi:predicted esterase